MLSTEDNILEEQALSEAQTPSWDVFYAIIAVY